MLSLLFLLVMALTAAWLLWRYAPERPWPLVRFLARAGAAALYLYAFILLVTMFGGEGEADIRRRLSQEVVPWWAALPMLWGLVGGWFWLHVEEWIFGRRGR